ncbi:Transmembrane protein 209 [Frankliniella fusca]|uniref:Transmembrane protein 209 n=1 Tax=Frankliniella fusca TaxID=407009 RepID=A0AAE1L7G5_9NEOP|nr:Transmembrane protein 209 [Frankliniella fusca]
MALEPSTPVLERTIQLTSDAKKARSSLLWGCFNSVIFSILLLDIVYTCPRYSYYTQLGEYIIASILFLNALYHFGRYIWTVFSIEPLMVTPRQQKLLGIKQNDPYIKFKAALSPTPKKGSAVVQEAITPMNMTALSWMSNSVLSPSAGSPINDSTMSSQNYSVSSSSWMYQAGSPANMSLSPDTTRDGLRSRQAKMSPNRSYTSHMPTTPSSEFIGDEDSLTNYLRDFDSHEKSSTHAASIEQPTNLLSSFWSHPASRTAGEVSPLLRRCTYQLASHSSTQSPSSPGATSDDTSSPSALYHNQEAWRRFKINPSMLTQWNANLRMWISQTILERLEKEIDAVDAALARQSISDVRVGQVGLERLRKTARTLTVVQNIPTLPNLVPFLELSPHQEYVVSRIRELAKGGCMSEFRWNSGGSFNGKPWDENLPTDATLVMHLLATYLDSQLLPLPQNPDGRPFSTQHLFKSPDKPPKAKNTFAIHQTSLHPPHYVLVLGEETLDVTKGRNNLFHTVLLFLYIVKTQEHGMLGRVNLGPSGVNILWVID